MIAFVLYELDILRCKYMLNDGVHDVIKIPLRS